jgi:predicted PurR-regulated permease PerM
MDTKSKFNDLKSKYGKKIILIISGILIIIIMVFIGKYYANKQVNEFVNNVRNEWSATVGREIMDNIAKVQERQVILENNYNTQKTQINQLKNAKKQEAQNVFNSNDPTQIANYFDNVIDAYIPSN